MRRFIASSALFLLSFSPSLAAEDLSRFGTPVDQATGAPLKTPPTSPKVARGDWPAHVCAEIQHMEKLVIEDARPTDRSFLRIGLLFLQKKHCGVDISAKLAADQKIQEDVKRQADRDFQDNMEAAAQSAARPAAPSQIIIQAPRSESRAPDPSPTVNCTTLRLGGGMSSTSCR